MSEKADPENKDENRDKTERIDGSEKIISEKFARPVVWTPEDAANFLKTAIKEAQQPLKDSLKRQGIPRSVFALVLLLFAVGGFGYWKFSTEELRYSIRTKDAALAEKAAAMASESRVAAMCDVLGRNLDAVRRRNGELEAKLVALLPLSRENETIRSRMEEKEEQFLSHKTVLEDRIKELERSRKRDVAEKNDIITELEKRIAELKRQSSRSDYELARARKKAELLSVQLEGMQEQSRAMEKQLNAMRALNRDKEPDDLFRPENPKKPEPDKALPQEEAEEDEGGTQEKKEGLDGALSSPRKKVDI